MKDLIAIEISAYSLKRFPLRLLSHSLNTLLLPLTTNSLILSLAPASTNSVARSSSIKYSIKYKTTQYHSSLSSSPRSSPSFSPLYKNTIRQQLSCFIFLIDSRILDINSPGGERGEEVVYVRYEFECCFRGKWERGE